MELKPVLHGRIKELTPQVGSLDASNIGAFKTHVRPHVQPGAHLVLNLTCLDFLDSSGLGALVWLLRETEANTGQVRLCCLQKPVQLLLEVVRMHRVFDIYPDADQAIKGWAHAD